MMEIPYHYQFRVIVIGDTMVGKSTLLKTFSEGAFGHTEPTVGVDFFSKILEIRPKSKQQNNFNQPSQQNNHYRTSNSTCFNRTAISNSSNQQNFKTHPSRLNDNIIIKLQIWDTAGQERFKSIVTSYYRNSVGIILVYDVTSRESYNHLIDWYKEARKYVEPESTPRSSLESSTSSYPLTSTPNNSSRNNTSNLNDSDNLGIANNLFGQNFHNDSNVTYLVIGCKTDLESQRQVSYEDGLALTKMYGFKFIETSSKSRLNVNRAFEMLAEDIYDKISESGRSNRLQRTPSGIHLTFDEMSSQVSKGIRIGPLVTSHSRRFGDREPRILEGRPVTGFMGGCC